MTEAGKKTHTIKETMLFESKINLAQLIVLVGMAGGGVWGYTDFKSDFAVLNSSVSTNTIDIHDLKVEGFGVDEGDAMRRYFELKIKYVERDLDRLNNEIAEGG